MPGVPKIPDYEMLRRIGGGAYGEVWLARSVTGRLRAVKIVYRDRFESERPFEREFAGIKQYEGISRRHASQLEVLHVGRNNEDGFFHYVMELADDADARADEIDGAPIDPEKYCPLTLKELMRCRGRLPVAEAVRIGADVAEALAVLHAEGLVHRDVKPSNIIFIRGVPKLADVGLVSRLSADLSHVGTEGYVPVEGPGSVHSDIFALGKVLYEMATGHGPTEFPNLPIELGDSPDAASFSELNEIILRACAPKAADRHATADELRTELLLLESGRSVRRLRLNERRMAFWRRAALTGAVVFVAGLLLFWAEQRRLGNARELAEREQRLRATIELRESAGRRNLYAADMNLARLAVADGNYGRAAELLGAYQSEPDLQNLRGIEWYQLQHQLTGNTVGVLNGHTEVVSSLALSNDGERLFSGSFDGTVREWSLATGIELRRWELPGCAITAMAVNADETRIAVEGGNRPFTGLLDVGTGQWTTRITTASPSVTFLADGNLLRGAGMSIFYTNGVIELIEESLDVKQTLPESGGRAWLSPEETELVTGPWVRSMKRWSWPAGELLGEIPDCGTVMAAAFTPDGQRFITASRRGELAVRTRDGELIDSSLTHEGGVIWTVAVSPDGKRIATGGSDQTVRIWQIDGLREEEIFRGHLSEVWAVAWSRDGQRLFSSGKDTTIRIWNAAPPAPFPVQTRIAQAPVFSADGTRLALLHDGGRLAVWSVNERRVLWETNGVSAIGGTANTDGTLALLSHSSTIQRVSVNDGKPMPEYETTTSGKPVERRQFSDDGQWFAEGMSDGAIRLYPTDGSAEPRSLEGHRQMIVGLVFSPSGRFLVSGSLDRTARLWETATGRLLHVFEGHKMGVSTAAFSPDETQLATGSWDDTVRLWNLDAREELAVLGGHKAGVQHVAFAPDGRTLLVLGGTGLLKFWSLGALRECGEIRMPAGPGLGWVSVARSGGLFGVAASSGEFTLFEAPENGVNISR